MAQPSSLVVVKWSKQAKGSMERKSSTLEATTLGKPPSWNNWQLHTVVWIWWLRNWACHETGGSHQFFINKIGITQGGIKKPPRSHTGSTRWAKPLETGDFSNANALTILMRSVIHPRAMLTTSKQLISGQKTRSIMEIMMVMQFFQSYHGPKIIPKNETPATICTVNNIGAICSKWLMCILLDLGSSCCLIHLKDGSFHVASNSGRKKWCNPTHGPSPYFICPSLIHGLCQQLLQHVAQLCTYS